MTLKGCSYVGAFTTWLHVSNVLGGRVGLYVNTSYIFPQGVLEAINLVGCVAADREARALGLWGMMSPCSMAITILSGSGPVPR